LQLADEERPNAVVLAAIIVLVTAAGVGLWLYRSDLKRARSAASRGSRIVDTGAGAIEYAERGAGLPLLSIHGAGGGFDQGLANVADFVGDDVRVIAPSRFGYLRTPAPADASAAAQADAHAALLSRLGVAKAVVVGISAGARSAVEFATRHPARVIALILIVPGTYAPDSLVSVPKDRGSKFVLTLVNAGADFFWWAAQKLAPSLLVRFVGVRPELLVGLSQAARRRVMDIVASIEPLSQRMLGINVDSAGPEREPRFNKIAAPTLIISARDDLYNTAPAAAFAASRIRGAELIMFETGGHLLAGRETEVRDAVRSFLTRVGAEIAA
jgi:pimeloyl-ACP methyl ester carboxylesterase